MSTGLHRRGLSQRGGLGDVRAGQRVRQSAGVRGDSRSARRAAGRAQQLVERVSAGRVSGHGVQRRAADRESGHAAELAPQAASSSRDFPQAAQRQAPGAQSGRQRAGGPDRQLRTGRQTAAQRAGSRRPVARDGRHARHVRHRRRQPDQGRLRPQLPAGPATARARRALRAALQRRLRDGRRRGQLGRPQDAQDAVRSPRPDSRSAGRGAADRS